MKRENIHTGEIYAWLPNAAPNRGRPYPIKILSTDHPFPNVSAYGRKLPGTHSGILAVQLDRETLSDVPPEDRTGLPLWRRMIGEWVEAAPRNVWHTWSEQQRLDAAAAAEQAVADAKVAERERKEQAVVDHMLALVPKDAWMGLHFSPGNTPHLTVQSLTRLLKAARTAALAEASEPFEPFEAPDEGSDAPSVAHVLKAAQRSEPVPGRALLDVIGGRVANPQKGQVMSAIQVRFNGSLGVGDPQIVEYRDGMPLTFEALPNVELSIKDGVLEIRATDSPGTIAVNPVSGNVIEVRRIDLSGREFGL